MRFSLPLLSRRSVLRDAALWLGTAGILLSAAIAIIEAINTLLHPLNSSRYDLLWTGVYGAAFTGVGLFVLLRRPRLLMQITLSAAAVFILVVIVFSENGLALLALAWLLLIATSMGWKILTWLNLGKEDPLFDRLLLAAGSGMGVFTFIILALGYGYLLQSVFPSIPEKYFHFLKPLPTFIILGALTVFFVPTFVRAFLPLAARSAAQIRQRWQAGDFHEPGIFWSLFAICLLGPLLWALAPSIRYDALTYHLGVTQNYIDHGAIYNIPHVVSSYWAHNADMLYTLSLLVAGQPLPGLLHLTFGLLTTGLSFSLGKRVAGTRVGLLSALLFMSTPIVAFESGTVYVDLFVAFYVLGAIYCGIAWWQEDQEAWLLVSGLSAGFAMGVKMNAAALLFPFVLALGLTILLRYRFSWRAVAAGLCFGLPAAVLLAPWLIRDWAWTGNPVFPAYNSFFRSPLWPSENRAFSFQVDGGLPGWRLLRLPWELTTQSQSYYREGPGGMLGILPLLYLPWLYAWSFGLPQKMRRFMIVLFILSTGALLFTIKSSPIARYIIGLLPLLSILAAINLDILLQRIAASRQQVKLTLLGLSIILLYLFSTRLVLTVRGWEIPERYPYQPALGLESSQDFLSRSLPIYDVFQFLDQQGNRKHKVLSIGNDFRFYTRSDIYSTQISVTTAELLNLTLPAQEIAQFLTQNGFDYLIVQHPLIGKLDSKVTPLVDKTFLKQHAKLEFARERVYLYKIIPESRENAGQKYRNLLQNPGFEAKDEQMRLNGWKITGAPLITVEGSIYAGENTVNVTGEEYLIQEVPVDQGEIYTLGYWARSETPGQLARLQIRWKDVNGSPLFVSYEKIPVGREWEWCELSATAPEESAYAKIYIQAEPKNQVWVDDVCFTQGDRCE